MSRAKLRGVLVLMALASLCSCRSGEKVAPSTGAAYMPSPDVEVLPSPDDAYKVPAPDLLPVDERFWTAGDFDIPESLTPRPHEGLSAHGVPLRWAGSIGTNVLLVSDTHGDDVLAFLNTSGDAPFVTERFESIGDAVAKLNRPEWRHIGVLCLALEGMVWLSESSPPAQPLTRGEVQALIDGLLPSLEE